MKILLDIEDNKAADFIEHLEEFSYIKQQTISDADAVLFSEVKEIKEAFKNAEKIKSGKLKGRSADEFIGEL